MLVSTMPYYTSSNYYLSPVTTFFQQLGVGLISILTLIMATSVVVGTRLFAIFISTALLAVAFQYPKHNVIS
jgi:hypothetical protein